MLKDQAAWGCNWLRSMLWVLPAGFTEQQARPAATKRKPQKGRAAPKGGGKAAGRRKLAEAAVAEPEAAQGLLPELASLKAAIQRLRGKEAADRFTPETHKLLWDEFYRSEDDLRTPTRRFSCTYGCQTALWRLSLSQTMLVSTGRLIGPDCGSTRWPAGCDSRNTPNAAGVLRCCSGRSPVWVVL